MNKKLTALIVACTFIFNFSAWGGELCSAYGFKKRLNPYTGKQVINICLATMEVVSQEVMFDFLDEPLQAEQLSVVSEEECIPIANLDGYNDEYTQVLIDRFYELGRNAALVVSVSSLIYSVALFKLPIFKVGKAVKAAKAAKLAKAGINVVKMASGGLIYKGLAALVNVDKYHRTAGLLGTVIYGEEDKFHPFAAKKVRHVNRAVYDLQTLTHIEEFCRYSGGGNYICPERTFPKVVRVHKQMPAEHSLCVL